MHHTYVINLPSRPYICERFKSYGDSKFYEMAETIAQMEETLAEINQRLLNEGTYNNIEL
jgi:hypothetical protein